jgi:hypothetical protein
MLETAILHMNALRRTSISLTSDRVDYILIVGGDFAMQALGAWDGRFLSLCTFSSFSDTNEAASFLRKFDPRRVGAFERYPFLHQRSVATVEVFARPLSH